MKIIKAVIAPLWFHNKNLQQTASGFGSKLTSVYKVLCEDKRWRRVYIHCFSNCGSIYIIVNGKRQFMNNFEVLEKVI